MDNSPTTSGDPASTGGSTKGVLLHLAGQELLAMSREKLWNSLTDLAFVVRCMPDVEQVILTESSRTVFRVKPGLAFFRGTLEISLETADARQPNWLRQRVVSKGVGSGATLETTIALTECATVSDASTRLDWSVDILELQGLLKPVGKSLIAAAANRVVTQVFARLRTELGCS